MTEGTRHTPQWAVSKDGAAVIEMQPPGDIVCLEPSGWAASMKNWPERRRLIRAAPDLLEALKDAREYVTQPPDVTKLREIKAKIDAAISKATKEP